MTPVNRENDLGPLSNGGRVAVIGGGPGGTSCAMTLLKEARKKSIEVEVTLYEPKYFGHHYNQCFGVISPPVLDILKEDFDIIVPEEMLLREITGYVLHSRLRDLYLTDEEGQEISHALRRVELDQLLLREARKMGVDIVRSRVTYVEFHPEDVVIYSESGCYSADVMVGAFGLDSTLRSALRKRTNYIPPSYLETVVTRIHPEDPSFLEKFEGTIHAHLPPIRGIEFGALVPKGNHITIVVAGKRVDIKILKRFMKLPAVDEMLPPSYEVEEVFKGTFPNGPAKGFFGNRFVLIGDSAGLIRPFKGKGINSAIITGKIAGETIVHEGISAEAFLSFERRCQDLIGDRWYGRFVRWLVVFLSWTFSLDPIIDVASRDAILRKALFNSVSGHDTYRRIVLSCLKPGILSSILWSYLKALYHRNKKETDFPVQPL
jgi:flavin-dependent dehydrogenase